MKPRASTRPHKVRIVAQLTPDQAARVAVHQTQQQCLKQSLERARERQRRHPVRAMILDAVVGLAGATTVGMLFCAYLNVIRW